MTTARPDDGLPAYPGRDRAAGGSAVRRPSRREPARGRRDPSLHLGGHPCGVPTASRACSASSASPLATASPRSAGTTTATSRPTSRVPLLGAVLHTLNLRLHPDELAYIARHAEDRVMIVDASLVPLLERFRGRAEVASCDRGGATAARRRPTCSTTSRCSPGRWTSGPRSPSSTSTRRRPCATRPAPPAARRASSTRTGRWCSTRWRPRWPGASASARSTTCSP